MVSVSGKRARRQRRAADTPQTKRSVTPLADDDPYLPLRQSIGPAREQAEFTARAVRSLSKRADWGQHQASLELTFYLCQLDYELKALIYRTLSEPENRAIWEKYLALCVFEAVQSLNYRRGRVFAARAKDPRFDEERLRSASKTYSTVVNEITSDPRWDEIKRLRNFAAAHHGENELGGTGELVQAQMAGWLTNLVGRTDLHNSFVVYCAHKLTMAIQQFAAEMIGAGREADPDGTPDQAC